MSLRKLTERQKQILDYIEKCLIEKGYPPSVREIGQALGLRSSATVHSHLSSIEKKGFLKRDSSKGRALSLVPHRSGYSYERNLNIADYALYHSTVDIPRVGRIAAGKPIFAVEDNERVEKIPWEFVRNSDCFVLDVVGDSMKDAGINDGDRVVIRKQNYADDGDIIAALIGEDTTIKRFFREKDKVALYPENDKYKPIVTDEITVLGKVLSVFRRVV
jgi:repressor LexA